MKEKDPQQALADFEQALNDLIEKKPETIEFCGKKKKVGWLGYKTARKISDVCKTEKDEAKRNVKICVLVFLNNVFPWFRWLLYPIRWRWMYYCKDLNDVEILKVVYVAKKKVPREASDAITILTTVMTDLGMTRTREEVNAGRAAHPGEPRSV